MFTRAQFVDAIVNPKYGVAVLYNHEYEQLSWPFFFQLFANNQLDIAAKVIGCANWGCRETDKQKLPDDPAGLDWKGPRKGKGKHAFDGSHQYPYGGLGLAHWDGKGDVDEDLNDGNLEQIYKTFGKPTGVPYADLSMTFDQLRHKGGSVWKAFLDWSTSLLHNPDFQIWSFDTWKEEYWDPANETFENKGDAALNSRIGNSLKGVAKELRKGRIYKKDGEEGKREGCWSNIDGLPTRQQQIDTYYNYKWCSRSESSAERALRQANQALRVAVLIETAENPDGINPI